LRTIPTRIDPYEQCRGILSAQYPATVYRPNAAPTNFALASQCPLLASAHY
jgi:hypothetical protein